MSRSSFPDRIADLESRAELTVFTVVNHVPGPTIVPSDPSPQAWNLPNANATPVKKAMPLSFGSSKPLPLVTASPCLLRATPRAWAAMRKVFGDFGGHASIHRSPPRWVESRFVEKAVEYVK